MWRSGPSVAADLQKVISVIVSRFLLRAHYAELLSLAGAVVLLLVALVGIGRLCSYRAFGQALGHVHPLVPTSPIIYHHTCLHRSASPRLLRHLPSALLALSVLLTDFLPPLLSSGFLYPNLPSLSRSSSPAPS